MFNKKETGVKESFDTLVGTNSIFEGNIESEGTIRIEGRVKGDIKAAGDVFVGESAMITGNIHAANIHLSGTIEGNIHSSGLLKIYSTAKLYGDIQVSSFVADEGALFQGKCSMVETDTVEKTPVKSPSKKSSREYKKNSVLDQIYEEKEKSSGIKED